MKTNIPATTCLIFLTLSGCAHLSSEPHGCIDITPIYGARWGGRDLYAIHGQRVGRGELLDQLARVPASRHDARVSRALFWGGIVATALEWTAITVGAGLATSRTDAATNAAGDKLLFAGVASLLPSAAGFFGGSTLALERAVRQLDASTTSSGQCPPR